MIKKNRYSAAFIIICAVGLMALDILNSKIPYNTLITTLTVISIIMLNNNGLKALVILLIIGLIEVATLAFNKFSVEDIMISYGIKSIIYAVAIVYHSVKYLIKNRHKDRLIRNMKVLPRKANTYVRIIIYCILVIVTMAVLNNKRVDLGNSLLPALWAVLPAFVLLSAASMISDVYIFGIINQLVIVVILYMEVSVGGTRTLSIVHNAVILFAWALAYIQYRRKRVRKRNKKSVGE